MGPMVLRTLLAVLSLALAAPPAPAGPDAARELRRLSSTHAAERESAQRWLAVHLAPADLRAVADAARDGDAETRRRLVHALSGADRHFELIVALCDDTGEPARALGHDALTALARAWLPGLDEAPVSAEDVAHAFADRSADVFSVPARHTTLRERIESIAVESDLGLPIVMTPELLEFDRPELRPALRGTALEILAATVREEGLSFGGVGARDEEDGPALLVVARRGRARHESGFDRLEEWCLAVRRDGADAERAALALASSGWPGALAWMEARAVPAGGEPVPGAALEGVLAAARRGLVAPSLSRPEARRALLALAAARLDSDDPAERRRGAGTAQALAELGPRGPRGEDCASLLLQGWDPHDDDEEHWMRCVVLEGWRSVDDELARRAIAVAQDPARAPGVRLQALRAVAAVNARGAVLDDAGVRRLWTHCAAQGGEEELLGLLGAVAGAPTEALHDAAAGFGDARYAAFLARWSLRARDREAWNAAWASAATDGFDDARRFAAWEEAARDARRLLGEGAGRAWLDGALAGAAGDASVQRFAAHAGLATSDEMREWARAFAARESLTDAEWIAFGHLAAGPSSSTVRDRLAEGVEAAGPGRAPALATACDAAAEALRGARRDQELRRLSRAVWKAVRDAGHPLHERLGPGRYPGRVELAPIPLGYRLRRPPF